MNKENLIKAILMIGGGYLIFTLFKPKKVNTPVSNSKSVSSTTSMDGEKNEAPAVIDSKDAEIVMSAYSSALKAGETPDRLTELNKEMMKEFGMRCYVDENNRMTVCDSNGNTILKK